MASPAAPENVPLHVLFPAEYRASCRMIVRDFAVYGLALVGMVSGVAFFF